MGWVNPQPENFRELYDVDDAVWTAGEAKHAECTAEFEEVVGAAFNDDGDIDTEYLRNRGQ